MRLAYVDGRLVPLSEAKVSILDRGFQFADAIYEVWAVMDGRLADAEGHFARLWRSLGELRITPPMSEPALRIVLSELVRRNRVVNGLAYLQITRGAAPREHVFPTPAPRPMLVMTASPVDLQAQERRAAQGIAVITQPETRWARCDIKSTALLPNVLAKQAAREVGASEVWFVDELGLVTEGGSSSAWIIDAAGALRTRDLQANILRGVTRGTLLEVAKAAGLKFEERAFTAAEARGAREAFITGAGSLLTPVVRIDGAAIGDGAPGPVAKRLRQLYIEEARRRAA